MCMYSVTVMGRVISPNSLNFGWVDYGKKIEKDHFLLGTLFVQGMSRWLLKDH